MTDLVQMIGKTFGRLAVTKAAPQYIDGSGRKRLKYLCSCVCGKEIVTLGENLRSGHTTSCGCQQDDNRRNRGQNAVGLRFGRLVVVSNAEPYHAPGGGRLRQVRVLCDCGNTAMVTLNSLNMGLTASCGCYRTELAVATVKHGDARKYRPTREYKTWAGMIFRCENPKSTGWECYGGRGIKVCDEWRNSFETFLRDMGRKPSADLSIDRIDVNGNYEPGNCRWATNSEQQLNKRPRA